MDFSFPYKTLSLNEEQSNAVLRDPTCHQRIVASAGSGKTSTLTARIAWLITKYKVKPESIVLMTFSRNAAKQMVQRIEDLIGPTRIWAGTFHGLARNLLNTYEPMSLRTLYFVDELIGMGTQWLTTSKGREWVGKLRYIVVDEFQDINAAQWKMVERMLHPGARLLVVGDDAQNIYTWRGSDVKFILDLDKKVYGLVDDQLRVNYRSSNAIIAAANATMKFIPTLTWKKSMISSGILEGKKPEVRFFWRMSDESRWIFETVKDIWKQNPHLTIAVLSRTNLDLFRCEEDALAHGIPYRLRDTGKVLSLPTLGDEDKLEEDMDGKVVDLVTLHASKGLEWDVVFVIHCNDDVFPSSKRKEDIICERRLFYVAVTRARKHLFFSYNRKERDLSRFVREIPSRLLQYHGLARFCLSEAELNEGTPTLESIVSSLDGDDFKILRDHGYLNWLDMKNIRETNLFLPGERWTFPLWAQKPELARDFSRFLKTFVRRTIASQSSDQCFRDPLAERLIFTLRIFSEDRDFWERWKDELITFIYTQFRGDEAQRVPPPIDYATVAEWCQKSGLPWTPMDILNATSLIAKIRGQLRPLRFEQYDLNEFTIGPVRFTVPTEMRGEILRSWRSLTDLKKNSQTILEDIWRISTLQVVGEGRNAPLFRVHSMKTYFEDEEFHEFLQNLEASLKDWIQSWPPNGSWQVGLEITSDRTQPETVDFYVSGCLWRIGGEEKERISSVKLLLLALTAGLAIQQGLEIDSIGILYPLEGRCITVRLPIGWGKSVQEILELCLGTD